MTYADRTEADDPGYDTRGYDSRGRGDREPGDAVAAVPDAGGMRIPRSRGVVSGLLLVLAGAWGALVPFVGPAFHFSYTPKPNQTWHWTAARGWYEVLPGGITVLGGLLLLFSANRIVTVFGAYIAIAAGGWFVVGQQVSYLLTLGSPGTPSARGDRRYVAEYLAFFTGLGAFVIFVAALAAGRLSVRSVRDARAAARRQEQALAAAPAGFDDDRYRDQYGDEYGDRYGDPAPEPYRVDTPAVDRRTDTWEGRRPDSVVPPSAESAAAVTTQLPVAPTPRDEPAGADDHAEFRRSVGSAGDPEAGASEAASESADDVTRPLRLEPPEGHPDAERFRAAAAADAPTATFAAPISAEPPSREPAFVEPASSEPASSEPAPTSEAPRAEPARPEPTHPEPAQAQPAADQPPTASVWNPEAQSPVTTGEFPAVGDDPEPTPSTHADGGDGPHAPAPSTRDEVDQPRRYFGADAPAAPTSAPTSGSASGPMPGQRAPVRTDEGLGGDDLTADDLPPGS